MRSRTTLINRTRRFAPFRCVSPWYNFRVCWRLFGLPEALCPAALPVCGGAPGRSFATCSEFQNSRRYWNSGGNRLKSHSELQEI